MIIVNVHGRMGNQYFEYAFARSLQIEIKKKYGIKHEIYMNFGNEGDMLSHTNARYNVFEGKINVFKKMLITINRYIAYIFFKNDAKKYKYSKLIVPILNIFGIYYNAIGYLNYKIPKRKNYILDGYFQSEKYFVTNKELIKKELRNKEILVSNAYKDSVCVHIRRGDYTSSLYTHMLVCTLDYYKEAIKLLQKENKKLTFHIFSDDIEWVKKNLKIDAKVIYEDSNKKYFENFEEMYNCENFILSNSSFSWWAEYLSFKSNTTIAPSIWNSQTENKDIYNDNWQLINVKKNEK